MNEDFPYIGLEQKLKLNDGIRELGMSWRKLDFRYKKVWRGILHEQFGEDIDSFLRFIQQDNAHIPCNDKWYLSFANEYLINAKKLLESSLYEAGCAEQYNQYYLGHNIESIMDTTPELELFKLSAYHRAISDTYDRISLLSSRNKRTGYLVRIADSILQESNSSFIKSAKILLSIASGKTALNFAQNLLFIRRFPKEKKTINKDKISEISADILNGIGYSSLAYDALERKHKYTNPIMLNPITIKGLVTNGKFKNIMGCAGILVDGIDGKLTLAFRGSSTWHDWLADAVQFFFGPENVYRSALGLSAELLNIYPDRQLNIYGHSLGGGLAQFCVAILGQNHQNIKGYGYNSAGLSSVTVKKIRCNHNTGNIVHLHIEHDPIMPYSGYHYGTIYEVKYGGSWCAHGMKHVRNATSMQDEYKLDDVQTI